MSEMTLNLDNKGLSSIVSDFDLLFIDIWGVIHNGIKIYKDSFFKFTTFDFCIKQQYPTRFDSLRLIYV